MLIQLKFKIWLSNVPQPFEKNNEVQMKYSNSVFKLYIDKTINLAYDINLNDFT